MVIRGRAITAIKKEQRVRKLKRVGFVAGLLLLNAVIYVGVMALAYRLPALRITTITVEGVASIREAEVTAQISELIKQNSWYIFPRYTMVSSPQGMVASLQKSLPWIEQVAITLESPHVVRAVVTERRPAYIVCAPASEDTVCYYADKNTLVFAPAPTFSAPVYPELRNVTASSTELMTPVFTPATAVLIRDLAEVLRTQGISMTVFEQTREGSYRVHTKGGWQFFFKKGDSVVQVTDSLRAAMNSPVFAAKYQKSPRSLEYVDVRLLDKVFYKFKTAEPHATSTPLN